MSRRPRLVPLALAAGALAVAPALGAPTASAGAGGNNVVQVVSAADEQVSTRAALKVSTVAGDTVRPGNVAVARGNGCSGCDAGSAAFQVVLVEGHPAELAPENAAVAVNSGCQACFAYAHAHQLVVYGLAPGTTLSPAAQEDLQGVLAEAEAALDVAVDGTVPDEGELPGIAATFEGFDDEIDQIVLEDLPDEATVLPPQKDDADQRT